MNFTKDISPKDKEPTLEVGIDRDKTTITSLEVAEMVGKDHRKLLRDIRRYCEQLNETKIGLVDFFLESTYKDSKGETRPCYLVTKKGCEFVAHKLTGTKGTEFTARYINRFHEMEQELKPKLPQTYLEALKQLVESEEEKQRLLADNSELHAEIGMKNQIIGELKPKADYTDLILKSQSTVTITQIAKDYGMSGRTLNAILHDLGVQYKESGQWLLYRKYHDMGYTHSETVDIRLSDGKQSVKMNTKWTQKGRLFLYELLKANGYLPMIEQVA